MAVNPKKLRPYDQPPRVREPIVPSQPDAAATTYLVAAVLWFGLAAALGALWAAQQIFPGPLSLKTELPTFRGTLTFEVSPATVSSGFWNALVYGWLTNAGLGAILFITPRVLGRRLVWEKIATGSAAALNIGLMAGLAFVYLPQIAAKGTLAEFPLPVDLAVLLALFMANVVFWRTLLAAGQLVPYVSLWFFGLSLLAFMGLYFLDSAFPLIGPSDTSLALADGAFVRGVETLWVIGVAIGTLYYLIPRASGNPLYSTGIAYLGWLLWAGLSTLSMLGALVDTSVPFWITQLGHAATLMLVAPAFLTVANLALSIRGRWSMILSPGTVALAVVSLAFFTATALLESIGSLGSVRSLVGGTEWVTGVQLFASFGMATFAFLAMADHAFPRLLRRDWRETILADGVLWATFAGTAVAGLALIGGGIAHGSLLRGHATPDAIAGTMRWFLGGAAAGIGLIGLGALAELVNLFFIYTSAPRLEYSVQDEGAGGVVEAAAAASGQ
jgi:cytochrome c oxidase cbb3-type subunit I